MVEILGVGFQLVVETLEKDAWIPVSHKQMDSEEKLTFQQACLCLYHDARTGDDRETIFLPKWHIVMKYNCLACCLVMVQTFAGDIG